MEKSKQVKSRSRVTDHGEVFTAEREVNAMLDLVIHETERIESRFLEPACGNGNFLSEILSRKMRVVEQRYGKNQLEFERYSVVAVGSIYGVELLSDNAKECRERLFIIFNNLYTELFKNRCSDQCRLAIRYVLSKNILCGDALTLKNDEGEPIVFSEWTLVAGSNIKRRDYTFDELLEANRNEQQLSLFQAAMEYDAQAGGFIPNPIREYPLTHYWRLVDYD